MLEISGIKAGYGPANVLQGISMSIAAGEIVAVLGSNGVGKSTLNDVISGIIKPREGKIRFEDKDIAGLAPRSVVEAGISQVPEGRRIFRNLSVKENLELGAFRRARERDSAKFRAHLRYLSAASRANYAACRYALRGRAADARYRRRPDGGAGAVILDEPSLGLSPMMVEEMFRLINRSTRRVCRSCLSSRTWCSRWASPPGPMCSSRGVSPSRGRPQRCSPIRVCARPIWDFDICAGRT